MLRFHPQAMLQPPKSPLAASSAIAAQQVGHTPSRPRPFYKLAQGPKIGTAAISRTITCSLNWDVPLTEMYSIITFHQFIRTNRLQFFRNGFPFGLLFKFLSFLLPWHPVFSWQSHQVFRESAPLARRQMVLIALAEDPTSESPMFSGKIDGFRWRFSQLNQSIEINIIMEHWCHAHEWIKLENGHVPIKTGFYLKCHAYFHCKHGYNCGTMMINDVQNHGKYWSCWPIFQTHLPGTLQRNSALRTERDRCSLNFELSTWK